MTPKRNPLTPQQLKQLIRIGAIVWLVAGLLLACLALPLWADQPTSLAGFLELFGGWLAGGAGAGVIVLGWRWLLRRKNGTLPSIDERSVHLLGNFLLIALTTLFVACCAAVLVLLAMGIQAVATTTLLMVLFGVIILLGLSLAGFFLSL
ncbi:hypothetical protein [Lacticaseibacillus daqingensis]|uniref:hypothetical protein n=1 Tax=Lacticaseibacillus daqingensis TaxID=2486014 RepID=UPI000F77C790|nr:hypothetical protein [Lacticaseibacillus daqingensis]